MTDVSPMPNSADLSQSQPTVIPNIPSESAENQALSQPTKTKNSTIVLDIQAVDESQEKSTESIPGFYEQINNWLLNLGTIKVDEKLLFFQLLGSMIGAGLPIVDSLSLLSRQTKNPKLKKVIKDMKEQIENGDSLAATMRQNDDVFDEATCAVIEAGEKSGKLNEIFKELVLQYEQLSKIIKKVKSVMIYPVIVVIFMILLTAVVLIFVVPKLEDLFGGSDNLPTPTKILLEASDFIVSFWYVLIFLALGGGILFSQWKNSHSGRRIWATFLLSVPLVGAILQKMILTRVTRIFGFLISAGVPVVESLRIASHISENPVYQEKLLLAADDLTKGISIAENLSDDERLFPIMLVNMMAIGEKTASLDTVMGKAADFYNEELDRKISTLSKSMEPIILTVIAAGAVFMILAIYLPILKMNDQVVGGF